MQLSKAIERYAVGGTRESIRFDGKNVGEIGLAKSCGHKTFFWNQCKLHMESWGGKSAYSMSIPLMNKLEESGVEHVYVCQEEKTVSLRDVMRGDRLSRFDGRFDNRPDYDQLVVRI